MLQLLKPQKQNRFQAHTLFNLFLPRTIKGGQGDPANDLRVIKQFHGALFDAYSLGLSGPSHVLKKMKGLWRYLFQAFEPFEKTLKKIKKTTRPDQYLRRVNRFLDSEARLAFRCTGNEGKLSAYPQKETRRI